MSNATKSETTKLIEAYGLMYGSQHWAAYNVQERYSKKFYALLNKLQDKHGGIISEHDMQKLSNAGISWWNSRTFRGPGVDW